MKTQIITLTTKSDVRAALVKKQLENAGIECFLSNINNAKPDGSFEVKIDIYEKDFKKALKLVEEIDAKYGKEKLETGKQNYKITRILVPVDFSEYSMNAAVFAVRLAEKLGAEIMLFHSFYNPMIDTLNFPDGYTYQTNMAEVYRDLEAGAKKNMKKFIKKLQEEILNLTPLKIKIKHKLVSGSPAEEILTETEKYDPGVIIAGTRGAGENPNELIGNVTASIMEKTETPLLIIPAKSKFPITEMQINVLYATDFDDTDPKALKKLIGVISPFNFSITCIHVTPKIRNSILIAKMKELRTELRAQYQNLKLDCELIQEKDIVDGIKKVVAKKTIHLIALTHHKRNIFYRILKPSLTKKVIFTTENPVLVFQG